MNSSNGQPASRFASALTLCWAWPWRTKLMVCVRVVATGGAAVFNVAAMPDARRASRATMNATRASLHGCCTAVLTCCDGPSAASSSSLQRAAAACAKAVLTVQVCPLLLRTLLLISNSSLQRFVSVLWDSCDRVLR